MKLKNPILSTAIAMTLMQQAETGARASGGNGQAKPSAEPAKVLFCKKELDLDTGEVHFTFEKGSDREETISVNVLEFPAEMQRHLLLHGMAQKGGDSYAGVKGNVVEAKSNLRDVIEQLSNGEWKGGGDEARPRLAELAAAIARIRSAPLEKVTQVVEAANDDQRKAWRSNAQVKATIAQIRAEKAAEQLAAAGDQGQLDINLGQ